MEFLILFVLIVINGLFAMSEIAVVSSRKARLQHHANAGSKGAKIALRMAEDPSKLLSTVQVGITTIGILSGAFGENAIAERLIAVFDTYPSIAAYSQGLATVIMVVVITFFSVVLGELVPKRLALLNPERIAMLMARPMEILSKISHPLVTLFSLASSGLLFLLGAKRSDGPQVTEEEIKVMLQQGVESGDFKASEQTMVANIFRLDSLKIGVIMTRRSSIVYLDVEDSDEENLAILAQGRFQTLPVCRGGLDDIVGLLDTKDYLGKAINGARPALTEVAYTALFVPETITPNQLLTTLRRQRAHFALVVDEYGDVEGMVTLTDLLEAIIGDLPGAGTGIESVTRCEDGSVLLQGALPIDRLTALLEDWAFVLDQEDVSYNTLGGFVMSALGRIPGVGDYFDYEGLQFFVVTMDENRVEQVRVREISITTE